jgi:hypothetical protein
MRLQLRLVRRVSSAICVLGVLCLSSSVSAASSPHTWLSQLNFYRRMANLPEVTENTTLSAAAKKHAEYLVKNDESGHTETPGKPGYSAEGVAAGKNSNVHAAGYPENEADPIDSWMESPFHALHMLNPALGEVGFGMASDSIAPTASAAVLDVFSAPQSTSTGGVFPVFFPPDGAYMPGRSHSGETPSPLTSCPGYGTSSGAPIMVQLGTGSITPKVTASSFKVNGVAKQHCVIDETNYNNPNSSYQSLGRQILDKYDAVVVMPKDPLGFGNDYEISLIINGKTYAWSFTTNLVKPRWHNLVWKWNLGLYGVWYMKGSTQQSAAWLGYEPDLKWEDVAIADLDNDGDSDVFQRHATTGQDRIAVFDGPSFQQFVNVEPVADTNWRIAGAGDFNRDGRVDLLWRNMVNGSNTIWLMDGRKRWKSVPISGSHPMWGWDIVGTGDLDGDYQVDILWRNPNHGGNAVWYMSEEKFVGRWSWLPAAAVGWEISATGELNKDGKLDILFRNPSTGQNAVWFMDDTVRSSWAWLQPIDSSWELIGTGSFE